MQEPPGTTSIAEFETLLAASEQELELIEGEVVAFAGGSVAHGMLGSHLYKTVATATQPPCHAFTSDVAVRIADRTTYVFPDVSRTCEELDPDAGYIVAPELVVEVISPESKARDRGEKLDAYQAFQPSWSIYWLIHGACGCASSGAWRATSERKRRMASAKRSSFELWA